LAERINEIQFGVFGDYPFPYLNVGGGLGIDYENPKANKIPDFYGYFHVFAQTLRLKVGQKVHFELGRSIVGQCGTLITRVLYVKDTANQTFVIVDAGMNDLLRPALYGARHSIENVSASGVQKSYTVVGPVCETSDSFGKNVRLSEVKRGDLLAVYSAGAYGETMGSAYNLRDKTGIIFSNSEILSVCTQPIQ
jgi:diaminopimelate decarboxylase